MATDNRWQETPREWELAEGLERVSRFWGWRPVMRETSPDRVTITFVPIRPDDA